MSEVERFACKRAKGVIEHWNGESGYREAARIAGPNEADRLLAEHIAQRMGMTPHDEEVRNYVAGVRFQKGF